MSAGRMAQNPHEYLIEQLQFTGDESVGSSSNKIKLNFNHPCKELIWVVQPDANVDYCASLECGQTLFSALGAQPFNYTDAIDALPNAIHAFGGPTSIAGTSSSYIDSNGIFTNAGAADLSGTQDVWADGAWTRPSASGSSDLYNGPNIGYDGEGFAGQNNSTYQTSSVSDAGTFVLSETALDMHCWGENPVVTAKLQLNGQDRFSEP